MIVQYNGCLNRDVEIIFIIPTSFSEISIEDFGYVGINDGPVGSKVKNSAPIHGPSPLTRNARLHARKQ